LWFPEGADSKNICLIKIIPTKAEYWDNSGFLTKLQWGAEAGKAYLKGEKMDADKVQDHQKVSLKSQEQSL